MKKRFSMFAVALLAGFAVLITSLPAMAETTFDHAVGLSYISGFSDIKDFYTESFRVDDSATIPVGISYSFTTNFQSGLRIDAGLGPVAIIMGDLEYYDVPLRLQGGYTFFPSASFRPYLKAGASYHISDGDYIRDKAGVGFLGSFGVEFGKRGRISGFLEVSFDTAEATFDSTVKGPIDSLRIKNKREDIKVHGTIISAGVVF